MNRKKIFAGVAAAALAGVAALSLAGSANASLPPKANPAVSPHGYVYFCSVINTKFSKTVPVLDYHGPYTNQKCGAGHQLIEAWAGALPATGSGPKGDPGKDGTNGTNGIDGTNGKDGVDAQALPYGIALVNVSRGGKTATPWGTYSTTIGSPVGDTASGTFRMACSAINAPCVISVQAYATASGMTVYPRLDISRQDTSNVPAGNCEYADGVDNNNSFSPVLSHDSSSPSDLKLGIGGTLDCGSAQTYPADGIASEIQVPAGFYDVASTFTFTAAS